jgi:hypothetical protein
VHRDDDRLGLLCPEQRHLLFAERIGRQLPLLVTRQHGGGGVDAGHVKGPLHVLHQQSAIMD